jgi:hypothetical protein
MKALLAVSASIITTNRAWSSHSGSDAVERAYCKDYFGPGWFMRPSPP